MSNTVLQPNVELVHEIFREACSYSARKLRLSDQEVVKRLQNGCPSAHGYFRYSLARQLASYLGDVDDKIKAAYLFGSSLGEELQPTSNINILFWVTQQSPALSSLLDWFESQFLAEYKRLLGTGVHGIDAFLDTHLITDKDVEQKIGYASLVNSLHAPALKIWERPQG